MTEGLVLPLDRAGIEAIIPHRDPFLLVDEIVELVPGESATGRYLVRDDAWYLRGHFPGRPIMPGVLQVEALAQVGAVCGLSSPGFAGRLALFGGGDGQERESLGAGAGRRGVVDPQGLAVSAGDRKPLVAQLDRADQGMIDPRRAAALEPDIVPRPQRAETLAADRQLTDQLIEPRVIDIRAD